MKTLQSVIITKRKVSKLATTSVFDNCDGTFSHILTKQLKLNTNKLRIYPLIDENNGGRSHVNSIGLVRSYWNGCLIGTYYKECLSDAGGYNTEWRFKPNSPKNLKRVSDFIHNLTTHKLNLVCQK